MNRRLIAIMLLSAMLAACGSDPSSISTAGTSVATAAPIRCPAGYTRWGNRCIANPTPTPTPTPSPTPTPTPTPTPVPTQTCWDGSIIPTTSTCPVQPPPPPPPPVVCPDGSTVPAGQTCPVPVPPTPTQVCPDGTVILATAVCPVVPPQPGPIVTAWVAAPVAVGGYACNRIQANTPNVGPCGSSIVYRITSSMMSTDSTPVPMVSAVFYQDASGQFPLNDTYAVGFVGYFRTVDLIGIAPAL